MAIWVGHGALKLLTKAPKYWTSKKMGISLPYCYTVYRNGTVPIADSRHGGGVNEVAGVGIKARMYVCLYIYIYIYIYMSM